MDSMLAPFKQVCKNCTICHLGRNDKIFKNTKVFSNMKPSKFVIVGQNPGRTEVEKDEPFVGDSGRIFNEELKKNNTSRDDFYITNIVKCYTEDNRRPTNEEILYCNSFLRLELNIIRPMLVITLGAVAYEELMPGTKYSDNLGKIVKSSKYGVKVFPIYHPSPRNLSIQERKDKFCRDLHNLCSIIKVTKARLEGDL